MSLELAGITRRFGAATVVDHVSLTVEPGDCHAFLGHNGAGKTTTMRIALGLDPHFEGTVTVDGFDALRYPREARSRLAGLIEVPGFHGALDGETNLAWLARLGGMGARQARLEARRLLAIVGLEHAAKKPVRAYSQGMRQRLGIAQTLIGKPDVVLLDEPTNGLDPEGIADVRALLARLTREEGLTVLVSSHQLAQLAGLCNKISVLQRGKLLISGRASELLADKAGRTLIAARDMSSLQRASAALQLVPRPDVKTEDNTGGANISPGGLVFELGPRDPASVLRELVGAGVELTCFAPHPVTLEELYLRYSAKGAHAGAGLQGNVSRPASAVAPKEQRAPASPVARVVHYEVARAWSKGSLAIALVLPALLALIDLWRTHAKAVEAAALVASGKLQTATDVTAFQALAQSLQSGLPMCAAVVVGISSQTLASEYSRGTLRNLLLRPVLRWQVVIGKAIALALLTLLAYAVLAGVSILGARLWFEFRGVTEILPDGGRMELDNFAAADLWRALWPALLAPIAPLMAWSTVGVCASALARSGALALALGLGAFVFTDLARAIARGTGAEGWLLSAHLPSPLGDTSFINYYSDLTQGISNAEFTQAATQWTAPCAWFAIALAISVLVLRRKSLP